MVGWYCAIQCAGVNRMNAGNPLSGWMRNRGTYVFRGVWIRVLAISHEEKSTLNVDEAPLELPCALDK